MMQAPYNMQQMPGVVVLATGMPRGMAQCYYKDCPKPGVKQCRVILCCKDYGCGNMMCDQHVNKRCIARNGKHGPPQYACRKCEGAAHRCSYFVMVIPCLFFLVILAAIVLIPN
mmetsp:Transcript_4463/g.5504  ORF Transcript_4463/g.5504 Transcript_4463/m.5504 type:complete len:114 (+) Transcript_4463:193-534(+)